LLLFFQLVSSISVKSENSNSLRVKKKSFASIIARSNGGIDLLSNFDTRQNYIEVLTLMNSERPTFLIKKETQGAMRSLQD